MTPMGLTDYRMIGVLADASNQLTVAELAVDVKLTPAATRRAVHRLRARGLVESGPCGGWQLTREGRVLWTAKGGGQTTTPTYFVARDFADGRVHVQQS
ncbi:MarR family transcriptional regulator [Nocardia sp. NPDC004711]